MEESHGLLLPGAADNPVRERPLAVQAALHLIYYSKINSYQLLPHCKIIEQIPFQEYLLMIDINEEQPRRLE